MPDAMMRTGWSPDWRRAVTLTPLLLAVLVFAAALCLYLPALGNEFAYDDVPIIALDERVRDFDLKSILTGGYWQDRQTALYRPLATVTFAVDWHFSGGSPAWFHFVNALWHAAVVVLLLQLLLALRVPKVAAFLAALVFAVHPVHVEAVANTVGRAELMAATFTLSAALLWTAPPRIARTVRGGGGLLALLVLGLLSKESAVVLPVLLVIVDIAMGRLRPHRIQGWIHSRRTPLLFMSTVVVLFFVMRAVLLGALTPATLDPSLEVLSSPVHRFYTALQAWPQYARLLFYPRLLLADYGPRIMMPATGLQPGVLAGAALFSLCAIGGPVAWLTHRRFTAAGLLWFLVAVFPVSNLLIPIGVLVAERTLYLPSVALSFGVAAAAGLVPRPIPGALARALAVTIGVAICLLAARTAARIPDWRSTSTIFWALRTDRPDSFRAVWHFARVAIARGEPVEALRLHRQAMELWPYRRRLVHEAALYASRQGLKERAQLLTSFALDRWPDDLPMRHLHAGMLLDDGDTVNARRHIVDGLRWHPEDALLLRMLNAASGAPREAPGS